MSIDQLRTNLIQRIEQADEKMLRVISSVADAVETQYVSDDMADWPAAAVTAMRKPTWAKPITEDDLNKRLAKAAAEIEGGEYVTLEELENEVETW